MVLAGRQMVGIFALLVVMLGVVFTLGYVLGRSEYDTSIRAAASSIPPKTAGATAKAAGTPVKESSASGAGKNSVAGKTVRAPAPDWDFYHAGEPAKPVERVGAAPDPADPANPAPAPAEAAAPAEPPARQPLEKQPAVVAREKPGAANTRKGPPPLGKGATKGASKAPSKAAGGVGRTSASRGDKSFYRSGRGRTVGRNSGDAKTGAGAGASKVAPAKFTGTGGVAIPRGSTVLQVAAVVRRADAASLAQALQKKKFPAFVTPPDADHFYRVEVGPYVDAQLADAARQKLEEQGFKISVKR